jgi:molybdenum cofactor cytidylyltransferase
MKRDAVAAIVLAAGTSSRFDGANKLLLPFGDSVVIRRVVGTAIDAGVSTVVVVTGHQREQVESVLGGQPVEFAHNPDYLEGEMLSSIKTGIRHLQRTDTDAVLICLGDQPLLPGWVIQRLAHAYRQNCGEILAPRFGSQRGHPVLIARKWWEAALELPDGAFMRDLLKAHSEAVSFIQVNTDAVLTDVDTPELYRRALTTARHTG